MAEPIWEADVVEISEGAPTSSDYHTGPEGFHRHYATVPQDEDEREPMFVQAHDLDYGQRLDTTEVLYHLGMSMSFQHHERYNLSMPLPLFVDSHYAELQDMCTKFGSLRRLDTEEYEDDETGMIRSDRLCFAVVPVDKLFSHLTGTESVYTTTLTGTLRSRSRHVDYRLPQTSLSLTPEAEAPDWRSWESSTAREPTRDRGIDYGFRPAWAYWGRSGLGTDPEIAPLDRGRGMTLKRTGMDGGGGLSASERLGPQLDRLVGRLYASFSIPGRYGVFEYHETFPGRKLHKTQLTGLQGTLIQDTSTQGTEGVVGLTRGLRRWSQFSISVVVLLRIRSTQTKKLDETIELAKIDGPDTSHSEKAIDNSKGM
ncbi:hypothetical protein Tco_1166041 [Tanacetum coccineum]